MFAETSATNILSWQLGCVGKVSNILSFSTTEQAASPPLFTRRFVVVHLASTWKTASNRRNPSIFRATALQHVYTSAVILTTFLWHINRVNKHRLNSSLICGCIRVLESLHDLIWSRLPRFFLFFSFLLRRRLLVVDKTIVHNKTGAWLNQTAINIFVECVKALWHFFFKFFSHMNKKN